MRDRNGIIIMHITDVIRHVDECIKVVHKHNMHLSLYWAKTHASDIYGYYSYFADTALLRNKPKARTHNEDGKQLSKNKRNRTKQL